MLYRLRQPREHILVVDACRNLYYAHQNVLPLVYRFKIEIRK